MTRAVGFACLTCLLSGLALAQTTGGQGDPRQAYRPGSGVTDPRLVSQVNPPYTPAAWQAGIEGIVEMEALEAVRQWRFAPATYQGTPVPILITLVIDFVLAK